jgi:hypothetical protein
MTKGFLLIGTSLNGLGKKQTFVAEVGPDIAAVVGTAFDALWKLATSI